MSSLIRIASSSFSEMWNVTLWIWRKIRIYKYQSSLVCFSHFGDQIINSELLCKVNSAVYLPNKVIKLGIPVKKYEKPLFTGEDVTNKFRKVLEDPINK